MHGAFIDSIAKARIDVLLIANMLRIGVPKVDFSWLLYDNPRKQKLSM